MSDSPSSQSRRNALKCLAYGGAGTLFTDDPQSRADLIAYLKEQK
jgi:hypothetical protein